MTSPLPQEIGRTEQALSVLLMERVLANRSFGTNDEWVAVNVLQRNQPMTLDAWQQILAEALSAPLERVSAVTTELVSNQCVLEKADELSLSSDAERELHEARELTTYVSSEIDHRLSAADRVSTVRALAVVRDVVTSIRERGFPQKARVR